MHQLDSVPGRDRRLPERRAAYDAAVVLDDDRAGVERELREQLEQRDAGPYGLGRSVHDDFHNASSICLAAAAGSVASHRARIAAAPCAPASRTSAAFRAAAGRQLAGEVVQVRAAGDALIGDGVEAREGRSHTNCWPTATPRPRIHSAAVMRDLPVGWTSSTTTAPAPAATTNWSSVLRTVPGVPLPSPT